MTSPATPSTAGVQTRLVAVQVLHRVIDHGRSLDTALAEPSSQVPDRERGLLSEYCYGVLRWYWQLESLLRTLLRTPLKAREGQVRALLLLGLYQSLHMRIPPYAVVSAAVETVRALDKPWAVGLTNGVLRNFQRRRAALLERLPPAAASAHPDWLLAQLQQDWPEHTAALTAANNERGPMTLRVNLRYHSREAYQQHLQSVGMHAEPHAYAPAALTLSEPQAVEALPGFADGWVSVQDAAAQLAGGLLAPMAGERILDACAAPGGKTGQLLEQSEAIQLTALDVDAERLTRVATTLARLGHQANLLTGDAGEPTTWWDGQPFDRILLDAPCSGSGVIRRHPDIRLLRRPSDIPELAAQQQRLLTALWPLLRPGGRLVYATCSIFKEENENNIQRFCQQQADAQEVPIVASWGMMRSQGHQILTGDHGMDGFYFVCIDKAGR